LIKRGSEAVVVQARATSEYFACAYSVGKYIPFDPDGELEIEEIALRGVAVAFVFRACDGFSCFEVLQSLNAATGKRRDVSPVNQCGIDEGGCQEFTDIAVARSGSVAWIQRGGARRVVRCDVACLRGGGRSRKALDRGSRISLTSLTLRGTRLSWVNAGHRKAATLR
jgi:hypothetical protein